MIASEAGFALIEVLVSAVLLVVLATATLSVIDQSGKASGTNRSRGVAAGLAQADQDAMRQSPVSVLANLHRTATQKVGSVTYTIKSDAEWYRDAGGVVSCSSSAARAEYVQITSSVTWPTMGSTKPVVLESYVAPGVNSVARGAVTVKLAKANTTGTAGIPVSVKLDSGGGASSGTTDANGCVVIGNLQTGLSTAEWNVPGYVDPDGLTDVTKSVSIATGQTSNINGLYDVPGTAQVLFTDDPTTNKNLDLTWPAVSALQTGMSAGVRVVAKAPSTNPVVRSTTPTVPTDLTGLFPFTTSYSFYAGSCVGSDPSKYQSGYAFAGATVPSGGTIPANRRIRLPIQGFAVTVPKNSAAPLYMKISPDLTTSGTLMTAACDTFRFPIPTNGGEVTGSVLNAAKTATVTSLGVGLPYGLWNVCVDDGTNKTATVAIRNSGLGGSPAPTGGVTSLSMVNGSNNGNNGGKC